MKIEKIITHSVGKSINIAANTVESLRINNDIKSTVRFYDNGFIGVAGEIGNADMKKLEEKAKSNLAQQIPYPETHGKGHTETHVAGKSIISAEDFVPTVKELISKIAEQNPQYVFSNKVNIDSFEREYSDSDGANYKYGGSMLMLGIIGKEKSSSNIFDIAVEGYADYYNQEEILADAKLIGDNFLITADYDLPDEMPVIVDVNSLRYVLKHFVAEYYCAGASLVNGKLGEKLFNEKLSLFSNRNPEDSLMTPFFDAEGVIAPDYKKYVLKNGVFCGIIGTKKTAAQYNVDCSGFAGASYDGVPSVDAGRIDIEKTHECLDDILQGQDAIYVYFSSGGDMTDKGDLALPVQTSFLYRNGKLCGKVKEFTLVGNIFDILGDNYLGATGKGFLKFGRQRYVVIKAKLNK